MTREGFEAWATNHHPWILADAKWHDDERRYTVMSSAQTLWSAWQAAAKLQREKDADEIAALKQTLAMSVPRHLYDEICAENDALHDGLRRLLLCDIAEVRTVKGSHGAIANARRLASTIDAAMKKEQ